MDSNDNWFLTATLCTDIIIITILTASLFLMFLKLRLRIDITGIVTLAVFWLSALTRVIGTIQN